MTNTEIMGSLYFDQLLWECFREVEDRRRWVGLIAALHEIPFYWYEWSDSNRAEDALVYRKYEFLMNQPDRDEFDPVWAKEWGSAAPSVLAVFVGIAIRWSLYYEQSVSYFIQSMLSNMGFLVFQSQKLPSSTLDVIRELIDVWMTRRFSSTGIGSPFPINPNVVLNVPDMRELDIWGQMNAYGTVYFANY